MSRTIPYFLVALLLAAVIAWQGSSRTLNEQLVHVQLTQVDPSLARQVAGESLALQALLLSYSHDPVLLAKARLAILRHPQLAGPILQAYGDQPLFQDVLRRYGEDVMLPIHYFREHDLRLLALQHAVGDKAQAWWAEAKRWFTEESKPSSAQAPVAQGDGAAPLTPRQRGQYALAFLDAEGYGFLGQFVINPQGDVQWLQTERLLEGLSDFFAGGIRQLEARWRQEGEIGAADVGWAAMDVAVGVAAFRLLRLGRPAAVAGRGLTASQRAAVVAAPLWRTSVIGARLARYGAPLVLAYVAIRHPSVLTAMFTQVGAWIGIPAWLAQWLGWTLVLLPLLALLRWVLGPLLWALRIHARHA